MKKDPHAEYYTPQTFFFCGIKLFQSAEQSCVPKINCNRPQHFSLKLTEKKKKRRSRDENKQAGSSGLQWKDLLKVNLTLNWLFCARAERGSEERWGGQAASQHLACSRLTCRGEPGRHLDSTARAGNRSLTRTCMNHKGDKDQMYITYKHSFNRTRSVHTQPHALSR